MYRELLTGNRKAKPPTRGATAVLACSQEEQVACGVFTFPRYKGLRQRSTHFPQNFDPAQVGLQIKDG
ncbi:MAG: hypothetical protein KME40_05600 [Komarekiella atlantica HA4396-MV6]|nr:hypothetical protein [Komarekiella atlantica HA4396-MV6]